MKIYTGNFANIKKYLSAGLFPVSIALSAKYFSGASYRKLAPEWSYKDAPEGEYRKHFGKKLSLLNKQSIKNELSLLSGSKDIVLLCYEKIGDFCHRHLVNEWIGGEGEFVVKSETKTKPTSTQMMLW